ncbi:TPA: morphogenetic protein [Citrobacter farmeri]|nr:morphogenetic protein [Citrobacter farmeri]HEM7403066.1 morphogenetic protein [Citrobacter farmeri]
MKERGMIFNGEMVRAILDGRKTQTRRIMKPQPVLNGNFYEVYGAAWSKGIRSVPAIPGHSLSARCPFGAVSDRIWVRETFEPIPDHEEPVGCSQILYAADIPFPNRKWTPSIHMPRCASRITLEITGVRVERLNSISQEDAQAEGMELTGWRPTYSDPDSGGEVWTPYDNFAQLWESIYGEESWQANPWVWVIEFKVVPNVPANSTRSDLH